MNLSHKIVGVALVSSTALWIGCGGSSPVAETPVAAPPMPANVGSLAPKPMGFIDDAAMRSPGSATDVISQFLDAVRRGGDPAETQQWLTSKAQAELNRIGQKLQPIGSPGARFTVTRAENVPEAPGSALVHSYWIEPTLGGEPSQSQVVWAVQWERESWRISGFAVQTEDDEAPVILDFENGDLMANYLEPDRVQAASTDSESSFR